MRTIEGKSEIAVSFSQVGVTYSQRVGLLRLKSYTALKNVSFKIYKGESVGILGSNGAGKSTILKLLAGIIKPDKGQISNRGLSTALLSLRLGFDRNLSGLDNIVLSGLKMGFTRRQVLDRLDDIVEYSGLRGHIASPLHTYSNGMATRLGFTIAMSLEPELLLIDEILGVGDEEFREKSSQTLENKMKGNSTVVLVSHNPRTMKRLCSRIIWIEDGVTRMEDSSSIVLREYRQYHKFYADRSQYRRA